jgi:choline dehydrogenase-like flavoprotein
VVGGCSVAVLDGDLRAYPSLALQINLPTLLQLRHHGVDDAEPRSGESTMLDMDDVDEELQRGFGLSINELEPLLRVGGDAAEMKFMECCRYLWQADGAELTEPFVEAVFNKLPDKSRCVLFQRMLTIVYVAQDAERLPSPPE